MGLYDFDNIWSTSIESESNPLLAATLTLILQCFLCRSAGPVADLGSGCRELQADQGGSGSTPHIGGEIWTVGGEEELRWRGREERQERQEGERRGEEKRDYVHIKHWKCIITVSCGDVKLQEMVRTSSGTHGLWTKTSCIINQHKQTSSRCQVDI